MVFTSKEKQAIVRIANMMIEADNKKNNYQSEKFVCDIFLMNIGVTEADIESSKIISNTDSAKIISKMDLPKRRIVFAILGHIMVADGHIADEEVFVLNLISALCNLPYMTRKEAAEELSKL